MTGPGLLGQPGLVEAVDLPAVEHRRGGEDLGDGDHAGAADAGQADPDVVGARVDRRVRDVELLAAPTAPSPVLAVASTSTVMNAGQSPFRHEKSRLHEAWSIAVLRPSGVSIGCTDRQLLTSPQSPQPSQMRWLMTTRRVGHAQLPPPAGAAQLGGARLVVDQHRDARRRPQLVLHVDDVVAVVHLDALRQVDAAVADRGPRP